MMDNPPIETPGTVALCRSRDWFTFEMRAWMTSLPVPNKEQTWEQLWSIVDMDLTLHGTALLWQLRGLLGELAAVVRLNPILTPVGKDKKAGLRTCWGSGSSALLPEDSVTVVSALPPEPEADIPIIV